MLGLPLGAGVEEMPNTNVATVFAGSPGPAGKVTGWLELLLYSRMLGYYAGSLSVTLLRRFFPIQ